MISIIMNITYEYHCWVFLVPFINKPDIKESKKFTYTIMFNSLLKEEPIFYYCHFCFST